MTFTLVSAAFNEGGEIPARFTCDGEDLSPPLSWSNLPPGTKSLVLVVDDPDAPGGTWDHWVLFDLPSDLSGLAEAAGNLSSPAEGGVHGINGWGRQSYGGPCPPSGEHRYFFRLYALDSTLGLEPGSGKATVLAAAENHLIEEAGLMGRYSR